LLCEITEKNIRHIRIIDDEYNIDNVNISGNVFIRNPLYEILDKINSGDTVKVAYKTYDRIELTSYSGDIETDSTGIDDNDFIFDSTGNERKYVRQAKMIVSDGTVISKNEWGLLVNVSGIKRYISPNEIIGFYKKGSEYYSYFQDSYTGGE
jgi:hypothetical protein